ncbi:MAG TPA: MFS transporter, partial [Arenicellales bacterium]|nr:MFS transporter [Arenicellales bacterium]
MNDQSMTAVERRAVSALSGLFGLRMLGLFLILPVFVLYARELEGQTPVLVGIALGAYGLTQALFQIPFGMLSDRFGRKPIISIGLLIFAFGSVVAAMADSILWVIIGRALQGSGAITAAILALTADLTRESQRTKAMAIIGGTIGTAFALAFILGPLLDRWIGVPGLFWMTGLLALAALPVLWFMVPHAVISTHHSDTQPAMDQFSAVLK